MKPHLHNVAHRHTDADPAICHDCRRILISDAGTERILVCPQVHGQRPPALKPKHPDGAVECGES